MLKRSSKNVVLPKAVGAPESLRIKNSAQLAESLQHKTHHAAVWWVFLIFSYIFTYYNCMKPLNLLNQIIEHAEAEDAKQKWKKLSEGEGEEAIGESWTIFHLKRLKELMENEEA
jgi:hypothetical protein